MHARESGGGWSEGAKSCAHCTCVKVKKLLTGLIWSPSPKTKVHSICAAYLSLITFVASKYGSALLLLLHPI
jgi:hypothetical protein